MGQHPVEGMSWGVMLFEASWLVLAVVVFLLVRYERRS